MANGGEDMKKMLAGRQAEGGGGPPMGEVRQAKGSDVVQKKSERRLVFAATDGDRTIRLIWLRSITGGKVIGSFFHDRVKMHRSYNPDGSVHLKAERPMQNVKDADRIFKETGYSRDVVCGPPLSSFTGYFPFLQGTSRLDADCFEQRMPYDFNKGDHPLILDSRSIQGEQRLVDYCFDLVQVGASEILIRRIEEYQRIFTNAGRSCEHHCYLEFEPWVLVSLAYSIC